MQYKEFKDGIHLSRLGMGVMRLPVVGQDDAVIDYKKAKEIIDLCMQSGINYYDTAYIYHGGKSEEFIGKALAGYPRESYFVADKFNLQANADYQAQTRLFFSWKSGKAHGNYKSISVGFCTDPVKLL